MCPSLLKDWKSQKKKLVQDQNKSKKPSSGIMQRAPPKGSLPAQSPQSPGLRPPFCNGQHLPQHKRPTSFFFSQSPGPSELLDEDFAFQDRLLPRRPGRPGSPDLWKISLLWPTGRCIQIQCDNSTFPKVGGF